MNIFNTFTPQLSDGNMLPLSMIGGFYLHVQVWMSQTKDLKIRNVASHGHFEAKDWLAESQNVCVGSPAHLSANWHLVN